MADANSSKPSDIDVEVVTEVKAAASKDASLPSEAAPAEAVVEDAVDEAVVSEAEPADLETEKSFGRAERRRRRQRRRERRQRRRARRRERIKNAFKKVGRGFRNLVVNTGKALGNIFTAPFVLVRDIVQGENIFAAIETFVKEVVVDGVLGAVRSVVDAVLDIVGGLVSGILAIILPGQVVADLFDSLLSAVRTTTTALLDAVGGIVLGAMEIVTDFLISFVRGFTNPREWLGMLTAVAKVVQLVVDVFIVVGLFVGSAVVINVVGNVIGRLASVVLGAAGVIASPWVFENEPRPLNDQERAFLERIYQDQLPYSEIRIVDGAAGVLNPGNPFVIGTRIHMKDRGFDPTFASLATLDLNRGDNPVGGGTTYADADVAGATVPLNDVWRARSYYALLVHESCHVWQNINGGIDYISEAIWAQIRHGDAAYDWDEPDDVPKDEWLRMNPEAQCQFLEDAVKENVFFHPSPNDPCYGRYTADACRTTFDAGGMEPKQAIDDYLDEVLEIVRSGRTRP